MLMLFTSSTQASEGGRASSCTQPCLKACWLKTPRPPPESSPNFSVFIVIHLETTRGSTAFVASSPLLTMTKLMPLCGHFVWHVPNLATGMHKASCDSKKFESNGNGFWLLFHRLISSHICSDQRSISSVASTVYLDQMRYGIWMGTTSLFDGTL